MRWAVAAFAALLAIGALMLLSPPASAEIPQADFGGNPRQQLVATLESSAEVLQGGSALALRVRIVDQYGYPVEGATISVAATGGTVTPPMAVTDRSGLAKFAFTANVRDVETYAIRVEATFPDAIPDEANVVVWVIPPPPPPPLVAQSDAIGAGLGAVLLAAFASTEPGRYGLFNLIIFPLYSRLKKEEVLDHFVRGQIYGYIMSHPGDHYNRIRDVLRVTNGTLAHHLRTLEVQGFIRAVRDGVYKRFYPMDTEIPRKRGIRLSDLQLHMLSVVKASEGPTQQEIADRLAVSQQTASYNLRHLTREGLVRFERFGRIKRYFPAAN